MEQYQESVYQPTTTSFDLDNEVITRGALAAGFCLTLGMLMVYYGSYQPDLKAVTLGAIIGIGGIIACLAWIVLSLDKYNPQVWDNDNSK